MSTPAVTLTKASKKHVPYINNPFFIATEGLKLFFTKALGIAVLLIIVSAFFHAYTPASSSEPTRQPTSTINNQRDSSKVTIPSNAAAIIVVLAVMLGTGVVIALLSAGTILAGISAYSSAQVANGKDVLLKDSWMVTLEKFWSLLWLQVLIIVKILAWALLFIIPGIVMAYRYSLASTAFFDKNLKGNAAIKESLALTKGSWITLFGAQTLFSLVTLGTLNNLLSTSTTAVLYRQFRATPLEDRPKAHGLSIAMFVLFIMLLFLGVVAGIVFASFANMHGNAFTF